MLVFSTQASSRLEYVVGVLLTDLLGIEARFTRNSEEFTAYDGAKINYSTKDLDGYRVVPDDLLYEVEIKKKRVTIGNTWLNLPTLSLNNQVFDVFAASFYLISRYEEYTETRKDDHNRFPAESSCLVEFDLISRPLVNEWALALLQDLKSHYPTLNAKPRSFEYLSTIDIDQAWKYKNKGLRRNWGGFLGDILTFDKAKLKERVAVQLTGRDDPFYNFDWQDEVHAPHRTNVLYFVQVGQRGAFDKNVSIKNQSFRRLIQRLHKSYTVGIHPSYRSNTENHLVGKEKSDLEDVLGKEVHASRQHFLMHRMPDTYQNLLKLDITEDHTLGYSTHAGFRAGIAAPFPFYDLTKEQTTSLTLVPFCLMDITPLHYDQLSVSEAKDFITGMLENVQRVGGLFVSLWHNESLSDSERWKGWRPVYEHVITEANRLLKNNT